MPHNYTVKTISYTDSDRAQLSYTFSSLPSKYTFSAWLKFKTQSFTTTGSGLKIGIYAEGVDYDILITEKDDGKIYIYYYTSTGQAKIPLFENDQEWHFIQVTVDSTSNLISVKVDGAIVYSSSDYVQKTSSNYTLHIGDTSPNYVYGEMYVDEIKLTDDDTETDVFFFDFDDGTFQGFTEELAGSGEVSVIQNVYIFKDIDGNWVIDTPFLYLKIDSTNGKILFISTSKDGDNLTATLTSDYNFCYPEFEIGTDVYTPYRAGSVTIEKIDETHIKVTWDTTYQTVEITYEFYVDKKYLKKTVIRTVKQSNIFANAQYCLMFSSVITDSGYYDFNNEQFVSCYEGWPDTSQKVGEGLSFGWGKVALYLSGGGYYIGIIAIPYDNDEYNVFALQRMTKLTDNDEWEAQLNFYHGFDRDGIYLEAGRIYGTIIYTVFAASQTELKNILDSLKPSISTVEGLRRACENVREKTGNYGVFAISNKFATTQLNGTLKIVYKPLLNKGGYVDLGISSERTATDYGHDSELLSAYCQYEDGTRIDISIENDNLRIKYNSTINISSLLYTLEKGNNYLKVITDQGVFYIVVEEGSFGSYTINPSSETGYVSLLITDSYTPTETPTQIAMMNVSNIFQIITLIMIIVILIYFIEMFTDIFKD